MNKKRAELHLHTTMSAMDGIDTARDYIDAAIEKGLSAIAVTDLVSVQAFPEFYRVIQTYDYNLKIIYGAEVYLRAGELKEKYRASVLVKNKEGLKNLYKLISLANTEYFDKIPITPKSELEKYRKGLLIGSGCDAGELYCAVKIGKSDKELTEIISFYDYIEVVPTGNFEYFIKDGSPENIDSLKDINKRIVNLAETAGKIVVAVSDAKYSCKDDAICREILMHCKGYGNYENQPDLSMRTTNEMLAEFSYLGERKAYEIVVGNTNKIANAVDDMFPHTDMDANYEADIKELVNLVYQKLHEKYGKAIPQECLHRADWELSVVRQNKRNIYNMLVCARLVEKAVRKGWTVGNRGSVASSYLAYLLGITEINPLGAHYYCPKCHYVEFLNEYYCGADMKDKTCECGTQLEKDGFTIPPETFFHTDGSFVFNIDLVFPSAYQEQAFEDLKDITKAETIRCGTISTISNKTVYNMIDNYCKNENINFNMRQKEEIADKLSLVKQTTGIHPGGVFVIPKGKEINDYTPVQYPANIKEWGLSTHFNYHEIEHFAHLLKVDILCHDTTPSMLRRLEELTGTKSKDIPLGDEKTMELFSNGKTLGVPEFETDYVCECVMNKVKTYSFDNLIRISGLSHGTDVWYDNGEMLIAEGKELFDIVSCRDDVMLYLISRSLERKEAFKISERIRKGQGLTAAQYNMLISEGVENWRLDSWCKIMYSFPRAHAASYVLLAYRVAYYKAHFPLEFYCAYFNINANMFDADLFVNNAKDLPQVIQKMKGEQKYYHSDLIMLMQVCQEMYEAGYRFISDKIKNMKYDRFCIENGMLKPEIKHN